MQLIPDAQEAEARAWQVFGQPGQLSKTLSKKQNKPGMVSQKPKQARYGSTCF